MRGVLLSILPLALLATACSGASTSSSVDDDSAAVSDARPLFADKIGDKKTRYPIVLEHGFAASAETASIWRFAGVAEDLMAHGHALVVADDVQPFNGVAARAATMEATLRKVAAQCAEIDGCDPSGVHVIAHSFGGLHAREYLRVHPPSNAKAEGLPRVVSLTTISTPNRGTAIADFGLKLVEAFKAGGTMDAAWEDGVNKLAALVGRTFTKDELVSDPDIAQALHDLSEANADDFAASHPAVDGVRYYTWAGVSELPDPVLHPIHPERVTGAMPDACDVSYTDGNRAFTTDALLLAPHAITGHLAGDPNDGMSTVESAKGLPGATFLGCIPADHLAEVGHYGTSAKRGWSGFDHVYFYRYIASLLADDEARARGSR